MGSENDGRSWKERRSDRRAEAAKPPHEEAEEQLKTLSSQWRRGIVSNVTGLRPRLDLEHDNVRGPEDAKVTLVQYGDYESTACKEAEPVIKRLQHQFGSEMRTAWRHFPIADAHPHAVGAAAATLAAAAQGRFWDMHDSIHSGDTDLHGNISLTPASLRSKAKRLGLDLDRYDAELADGVYLTHVFEDFNSGVKSGVNGCPTFFVNEQRLDWDFDVATLEARLTQAVAKVDEDAPAPA